MRPQRNEDPTSPELTRRQFDQPSPLGEVLEPIERAVLAHDPVLVSELVAMHTLQVWFGQSTERLRQTLAVALEADTPYALGLRAFQQFVTTADASELEDEAVDSGLATEERAVSLLGKMFRLRLAGRSTAALDLASELRAVFNVSQPLFDVVAGWSLFTMVQHGITAMLAGRFDTALANFEQAQAHVMVPSLPFLTRDAYVKQALVHAAYGDERRAAQLLGQATEIPRTESWVEASIDVTAGIAKALLNGDPSTSVELLDSIPVHLVGEMWPFYTIARHRALASMGETAEAERHIRVLEGMPLPRNEGEGFSGSVLAHMGALNSMVNQDLTRARERMNRADSSIAVTQIILGVLESVSGRPREALQVMSAIHTETRGLRQLELWRLAVISGAHLSLGERDECRDVLKFTLDTLGELTPRCTSFFRSDVRAFAAAEVAGWPAFAVELKSYFDQFPEAGEILTPREIDVLRELARGNSREQISKSQFISMNTLKAHLRSVYRKLDVKSRALAVLEAERRGLV